MDFNFSLTQWIVIAVITLITAFKSLVRIFITYHKSKDNLGRLNEHLEELDKIDGQFDNMTKQSRAGMKELREKAHLSAIADEKKFSS